jgi:hypothetical protein
VLADPDLEPHWSLSDRLQMLAFETELAHLPPSLIAAIWTALESLESLDSHGEYELRSRRSLMRVR